MSRSHNSSKPPAWISWLAVPWRDAALLAAIVAAAAAPVMLVASADVWRSATENDVAELAVDRIDLASHGVDVTVETRFDREQVGAADTSMIDAIGAIPDAMPPERFTYTLPGLAAVGPPPLRPVGPKAVLFGRDDALAAIDIVDEAAETEGGVWVTTWFAERHELSIDDLLLFEAGAIVDEQWNDLVQGGGASSVFPIVGTYEPLWSEDPDHVVDDYWSTVPAEVIPRYVSPFNEPNIELMITDEDTLLDSGLTGITRWQAPLSTIPTSFDDLRQLRTHMTTFESGLVGTGSLSDDLAAMSTPGAGRPRFTTDLFDTVASVEAAAEQLKAPLTATQGVGAIIGLLAVAAVGFFFVERRRSEFRLLAGEGVGWAKMTTRVASQFTGPMLLGAGVGVAAAVGSARWLGPADRFEVDAIAWSTVGGVAVLSILLAACVAGARGALTLTAVDRRLARSTAGLLMVLLVLATAATWFQVSRTVSSDDGTPDLVVIMFPVLTILTLVLVLLAGLIALARRAGASAERLPTEGFLAVRRIGNGSLGLVVVAAAMGLGTGLLVFSIALSTTLDSTVDVKLATEIGGETSASIVDDLPPDFVAPGPTTVIKTSDTTLSPGGARARVIAIDPETYFDAVTWPAEFDADPEAVLATLSLAIDDSLPMVAIDGEAVIESGAFGFSETFPYRVVDRVGAFPGAGESRTTLLVLADAVDEFALEASGFENRQQATDAGYRFPIDRFRQRIISQASASQLTAALDRSGVRYRDVVSRAARQQEPGVVANRTAFGYLSLIGLVAIATALGALALYQSAQRRNRALTGVMTRTMGLSATRAATVSVIELLSLVIVAVIAGFLAAPLLVAGLSERFDPAPERPPSVPVLVAWTPLLIASVAGFILLGMVLWIVERSAEHRPAGRVDATDVDSDPTSCPAWRNDRPTISSTT
jgi:hypothetical protein